MQERFPNHNHRRNKDFLIEFPDLKDQHMLSPRELEQMLNKPHPICDAGNNGQRVGIMTIREFLEKFG